MDKRNIAKDKIKNIGTAVGTFASEAGERVKNNKIVDKFAARIEEKKGGKQEEHAEVKQSEETSEKKDREQNLDEKLKTAVNSYNYEYARLEGTGSEILRQRERAVDVLDNVENLINSIANHPKSFDTDFEDIRLKRDEFKETCEFAKEELDAAIGSAFGAGAGVAGSMAIASLAPSAAMWVATTFGTASTGTAISALSGAAAQSAALAWLGGGALAAGGGGVSAGTALLALSGPIGWSIGGATLLTSVVLFANKKHKLTKEKKEEIEAVLKNTEQIRETNAKLSALLEKVEQLRLALSEQYTKCMCFYGKNFIEIPEEGQTQMGTLVNNAMSLACVLSKTVEG